jgi:hypothetical protein
MTVAELATYRVPTDPSFPAPGAGYVEACSAFYERGFCAPLNQFLRLLLQFYGLELHHLTPSRILHITAFITLCEAYMGIEPHFKLWKYFFRTQLQSDPDAKAAMLGCVDVYVHPG